MWFFDQDGFLVNSDKFRTFFIHNESQTEFQVVGREPGDFEDAFVRVAKFGNRKDAEAYLGRLGRFLDARTVVGKVRVMRTAGEDIAEGQNWIDRDWLGEFQVVRLTVDVNAVHLARGTACDDILKGQKCWFDPADGKLFLEK